MGCEIEEKMVEKKRRLVLQFIVINYAPLTFINYTQLNFLLLMIPETDLNHRDR